MLPLMHYNSEGTVLFTPLICVFATFQTKIKLIKIESTNKLLCELCAFFAGITDLSSFESCTKSRLYVYVETENSKTLHKP